MRRPLAHRRGECEKQAPQSKGDDEAGNLKQEMTPHPKMLSLVTDHVLPQHQQKQHHYYNRAEEFDRSLADRAMPRGFRQQQRLGGSDRLASSNDRLSTLDSNNGRRDTVPHLSPSLFSLGFVVFEIRDDQGTKDLPQHSPAARVIFGGPYELFGLERRAGGQFIPNRKKVGNHHLLPALQISADDSAYPEPSKLATAADDRHHHHRLEVFGHKPLKLRAKPM